MISTKDLSGLPNAERLKNFCKGLAALDIIMVEEEWSFIRHYTYNPAWRKGKEAFFATDGSDQSMIVLFAPEGCVINGVDSELYDWEEKFPRIEDLTDGMPPALQKLMGSREVKKMKSTFCVWTEDGSTWHCNPMDGEDASKDLLPLIDGDPQTYVEYAQKHEARFVKLLIQQNEMGGKRKLAAAAKQLEQVQSRIAELSRYIKRLYEDNVNGKISDERFMEMSADYEAEQRELKDRAAALQGELDKAQEATVNAEKFMSVVRKYLSIEELTHTLLREMVEKIVVYECEYDENEVRRQRIDIYYSFVGKIDLPEE